MNLAVSDLVSFYLFIFFLVLFCEECPFVWTNSVDSDQTPCLRRLIRSTLFVIATFMGCLP